jgi:hypothetical protein
VHPLRSLCAGALYFRLWTLEHPRLAAARATQTAASLAIPGRGKSIISWYRDRPASESAPMCSTAGAEASVACSMVLELRSGPAPRFRFTVSCETCSFARRGIGRHLGRNTTSRCRHRVCGPSLPRAPVDTIRTATTTRERCKCYTYDEALTVADQARQQQRQLDCSRDS